MRLLNIQKVVQETKNSGTTYAEIFIRQLDDLIEALTRLDPDAVFKNDIKALAKRFNTIKNRSLTKTIIKRDRRNIQH